MHAVLRMLDANLNRGREGLRVVEDWARFVRDDAALAAQIREIRSGVSALHTPEMVAARDASADVGMGTPQRMAATTTDMVIANAKRVTEALRVVEEGLKVVGGDAAMAEGLRHRFYVVEQRVTALLARPNFADVRVYVLITEALCKRPWLDVAERALGGGARCLQLREPTLPVRELMVRVEELLPMCAAYGVPLILNDRADVAAGLDGVGVHVGQSDLPAAQVRKLVGDDRLIGVSTHNVEQVKRAITDGADYVGVGPVFPSSTKPRDFLPGLGFARQAAALPIPTVAIGGITLENAAAVFATGVSAVAVTACVCGADEPGEVVEALRACSLK